MKRLKSSMKTISEHLKTHKNGRRMPKCLLKILMDPSKALSSIAITSFICVQHLNTSFYYDIRLHIPEQDVPEEGVFAGSVSKKIYIRARNTVCWKIISIKICRIKVSDTSMAVRFDTSRKICKELSTVYKRQILVFHWPGFVLLFKVSQSLRWPASDLPILPRYFIMHLVWSTEPPRHI